jgi:hypothetical protein
MLPALGVHVSAAALPSRSTGGALTVPGSNFLATCATYRLGESLPTPSCGFIAPETIFMSRH